MGTGRSRGGDKVNREEAKRWAALFTALANGEELQYRSGGKWTTTSQINPVAHVAAQYRIKPKPIELEVWYNPNPSEHMRSAIGVDAHTVDVNYWKARGYTKIKVREVQD